MCRKKLTQSDLVIKFFLPLYLYKMCFIIKKLNFDINFVKYL